MSTQTSDCINNNPIQEKKDNSTVEEDNMTSDGQSEKQDDT